MKTNTTASHLEDVVSPLACLADEELLRHFYNQTSVSQLELELAIRFEAALNELRKPPVNLDDVIARASAACDEEGSP